MSKRVYKRGLAGQMQWIQQQCPNALRVPILMLLLGCGLSALSACKTYYKRGEDGSALAADQAECQRHTGDVAGEQYQACLRELGWSTTKPPLEAGEPKAPKLDEQDAEKSVQALSKTNDPVETESTTAESVSIDVKSEQAQQDATSIPSATVVPQPPKGVGSWFKLGGNPTQLKTDQAQCLKEIHDSKQTLIWSADPDFLACMRDRGWRALAE